MLASAADGSDMGEKPPVEVMSLSKGRQLPVVDDALVEQHGSNAVRAPDVIRSDGWAWLGIGAPQCATCRLQPPLLRTESESDGTPQRLNLGTGSAPRTSSTATD